MGWGQNNRLRDKLLVIKIVPVACLIKDTKRITCELSNIVYLITCSKCKMYCVGETSREFRKRIYEHRNSVLNPKPSRCTPVSIHFTQQNHKASHMEISALEWCKSKFGFNETGLIRRHELSWIFKLHSLAPLGINQHV